MYTYILYTYSEPIWWLFIVLCLDFPSGLITTDMDPSNPYYGTNSSSVAAAILVPFFALILSGFAFYLYKHR